jgi:simple sugar transport system permease protein
MLRTNENKTQAISEILKYIVAVAAVMAAGAIIINFQGGDSKETIKALFEGAFGGTKMIGNTLRWITPCLLTGIAATVAFKAGIWNLGIGGQLYFGAFAAAIAGIYLDLPPVIFPVVCILIGGIFGLIFALIPALLKLYLSINEMISTLMLNYIGALVTEYMTKVVKGISAANNSKAMATPPIRETAELTKLIDKTNANTGIFIAILLIAAVFLVYRYTIVGYEMKQVGANQRFSKVGGIRTTQMYLNIFLVSGFIAGLAGAVEVLGVYGKFTPDFASNIGWDGIMIATIAHSNPIGVALVGALWGSLKAGALHMERVTTTNRLTVELMQAMFVLFVTIDYRKLLDKLFGKRQRRSHPC